jgi:hypothetical protein
VARLLRYSQLTPNLPLFIALRARSGGGKIPPLGRHMNKSALALAGFGFAAGIVLFIVFEPLSSVLVARFEGQSPNENLVRLYQELAANGIKRTLRD